MFKLMLKKHWEIHLANARAEGVRSGIDRGFREGVESARKLLLQKDKVYLEGLTLQGDHQVVSGCGFLCCEVGVKIEPEAKDNLIQGNHIR